jgi:hypothetical protein
MILEEWRVRRQCALVGAGRNHFTGATARREDRASSATALEADDHPA